MFVLLAMLLGSGVEAEANETETVLLWDFRLPI